MGTTSPGWQRAAWIWTVRYWSLVCLLLVLLPVWVTYINRENDFSPGDQLGLVASLVPAALGILLAFSLNRLARLADSDSETAGDLGQHLGLGLIVMSLAAMFLSLLTFSGLLFIQVILGHMLPAGQHAGTSAELTKTASHLNARTGSHQG